MTLLSKGANESLQRTGLPLSQFVARSPPPLSDVTLHTEK
jgi:hypothetical protein